jgi:hypothetical protein
MNKYLVIIFITLGLTACSEKNEQYYRSNPKELQKAMRGCPKVQPEGMNCKQIENLGNRMNTLAYQLQFNPQEFGNKILDIQQTIAKQKLDLTLDGAKPELKAALEQNEHDLADYLAVVKWLESPES